MNRLHMHAQYEAGFVLFVFWKKVSNLNLVSANSEWVENGSLYRGVVKRARNMLTGGESTMIQKGTFINLLLQIHRPLARK